jgi:hypothetical protein
MLVRTWFSRKRQGHALTSFGVAHVRNNSLRLLRYARIAHVRGAESLHDALEVFDDTGRRLVVAGAAQWKPLIEERRPAARPSDTPAKR